MLFELEIEMAVDVDSLSGSTDWPIGGSTGCWGNFMALDLPKG